MAVAADIKDVTYNNIKSAQARIAAIAPPTPILHSIFLENLVATSPVVLKLENLNVTGSFKIRGAANALMQEGPSSLKHGVVAASAGNHAQGVAYVCRTLGVPATIFMPERTPLIKAESTSALGATIHLTGQVYDEAYEAALKFRQETSSVLIHPYADARVICGQGTIGLELLDQIPNLGMVVVPIGGGGLISGIGCALKARDPNIKVIGVQSSAFPAMKMSFESGQHVQQKPIKTIADGIAVKMVHELNLAAVRKFVDRIIAVSEEEIAAAILELGERNHLLAEGAGATSVAGLKKLANEKALEGVAGKTIACIISGGNIDINLLRRITTRGLIDTGRLMRLRFTIEDKPGALANLLSVIGKTRANISEVHHDRTFATSHYSDVEVDAIVETSNYDHQLRLQQALTEAKINYLVVP